MDLKFDQGSFDITLEIDGDGMVNFATIDSDSELLMQRLFLRFKTFRKDLFWNINYGIDYLNDVFGKGRPKNSVDVIIRDEILKEPMVDKVVSFESEVVNYNYACKFVVRVRRTQRLLTYYILTNEEGVILTNENGDILTSLL